MSEPKRDDEPTMEEILASIRKIISEDDPVTAEAATEDAVEDAPEPMELTQMVSEDGSVVDLRAERQANPKPAAKESLGEEPVGEEAAEAPTDPGSDEESESAVVEPLVPQGTRVHAELVSEDEDAIQLEPQDPEPASRDSELELVSEIEPEIEPEAEFEIDAETKPEDLADIEEVRAIQAAADPEPESLVSAEATAAATAAMSRLKDRLAAGNAFAGGSDRSLEALVRETMAPHLKSWLDRNLPELVERIVREEIEKMVKRTELR